LPARVTVRRICATWAAAAKLTQVGAVTALMVRVARVARVRHRREQVHQAAGPVRLRNKHG